MSGSRNAATAKSQTDVHSRAVAFDRCVNVFCHASKVHDVVEFTVDFRAFHSQYCAVEVDIFTSGQFRVKSCSHFQETGQTGGIFTSAVVRLVMRGEYFQALWIFPGRFFRLWPGTWVWSTGKGYCPGQLAQDVICPAPRAKFGSPGFPCSHFSKAEDSALASYAPTPGVCKSSAGYAPEQPPSDRVREIFLFYCRRHFNRFSLFRGN